jgi:regulator of sigma E protease
MSPFAIKALQLLLSLSLLIVLHELGHFIPAKLFKTRVEKFYLFFDVKYSLFKKKIGETVYGIGWLPLGGYVKIAGMIDESMDKEQMAGPPQPWEFRSKPAWQRLIIMLGGVTVNVIVGLVIYISILFFYGRDVITADDMPEGFAVNQMFQQYGFRDGDLILELNDEPFDYQNELNKALFLRDVRSLTVRHSEGSIERIELPKDVGTLMFQSDVLKPFEYMRTNEIDTVLANFPAGLAGLQKGDFILNINNTPVQHWHEFNQAIDKTPGAENTLIYKRGLDQDTLVIATGETGQIGVNNFGRQWLDRGTHLSFSLGESFSKGTAYGVGILTDYVKQFKYVFTKKGATQVGGFGAIGNLFPGTWDWLSFWQTTALISIILAFMNILPIPALDGGHVMFLLYEMVSGRKPNDKFMEYAQMIGFFILIALVLFANGNDVVRWLFG